MIPPQHTVLRVHRDRPHALDVVSGHHRVGRERQPLLAGERVFRLPDLWLGVLGASAGDSEVEAPSPANRDFLSSRSRSIVSVPCVNELPASGRTADALEHLRQAIDRWEGCRDLAKQDSDFDPIRDEPAFRELVEG